MFSRSLIYFLVLSSITLLTISLGKHQQKDSTAWAQCSIPGSKCSNTKAGFSGSKVHKVRVITPTKPTGAQATQLKMMAGFGAPTKKKKEAVGTGTKAMKKQIANFVDLKKANAKVTEVFVREKGQDHWNLAGEITAEGDALEVGAYLQKRLIFDHMKETLAFLKQTKKPLEIGVGDSANAVTPVPKMDAEFIKCGFRPSETNSGPFFKATDQFGLKARIDTSSKTGSLMNESDEEL